MFRKASDGRFGSLLSPTVFPKLYIIYAIFYYIEDYFLIMTFFSFLNMVIT